MNNDNCRYTETHEWVRVEGGCAAVGITNHAQEALGDITFVELPKIGTAILKGTECGIVESVKAASDLYSPLSGTVSEVNSELESAPETINSDPMGKGWIFKLKDTNPDEINALMTQSQYDSFLEAAK